ncbi:MAG: hypothetical protein WKF34_08080 [Pyrinomonadaceae bacterium]
MSWSEREMARASSVSCARASSGRPAPPYEVATVDEIFDFYKSKGFSLEKVKSGGVGLGCNEFVFKKP